MRSVRSTSSVLHTSKILRIPGSSASTCHLRMARRGLRCLAKRICAYSDHTVDRIHYLVSHCTTLAEVPLLRFRLLLLESCSLCENEVTINDGVHCTTTTTTHRPPTLQIAQGIAYRIASSVIALHRCVSSEHSYDLLKQAGVLAIAHKSGSRVISSMRSCGPLPPGSRLAITSYPMLRSSRTDTISINADCTSTLCG